MADRLEGMKKTPIVEFDPKERILEKARRYVDSLESFVEENDHAIPLLLKAIKYADRDLKLHIMLLLGSFAKEEVAWPLYGILSDSSESEEVRQDAAIQLSVIGPFLREPQPLIDQLLKDMESPDAEVRLHATFAVGWEGNSQAAIPLIERLYDGDSRVQQTAVNALCNLRDDRILNLLLERLEHGPYMQKKAILYNLWRFYSRQEEVTDVYLNYLKHEDPDLRFDALVLLGPVTEVEERIEVYRTCLKDGDGRIRKLALRRLDEAGSGRLQELKGEIEALLDDPDMEIKRVALQILKRVR
jgi:HEAT repeat protein